MTDEINPHEEEKAAIDRLAQTHDGRLLHRYLRRVLEACVDFDQPHTLQAQNGRRSLARDLMRLMAEGIDDRHDSDRDAAILTRSGGAVAVRPTGRRDPASFPRVDSYADTLNPDGSDKA